MIKEKFLSIGEISEICNISTHRLRHYNKIGLLFPKHVDETSGRRYYSEDQIFSVFAIKELRRLSFSLDEIMMIFNGDFSHFEAAYINKLNEVETQLGKLSYIRDNLKLILNSIGQINKSIKKKNSKDEYSIELKEIPPRNVYYNSLNGVFNNRNFIKRCECLSNEILYKKLSTYSNYLTLFYDDLDKCFDEVSNVLICKQLVNTDYRVDDKSVKRIPGGLYATLLYNGGQKNTKKKYKILKDWIKNRKLVEYGPVIEVYFFPIFKNLDFIKNNCLREFQILINEM